MHAEEERRGQPLASKEKDRLHFARSLNQVPRTWLCSQCAGSGAVVLALAPTQKAPFPNKHKTGDASGSALGQANRAEGFVHRCIRHLDTNEEVFELCTTVAVAVGTRRTIA